MTDCPNCEYHKKRTQLWRDEAYKQAGHPLPDREQEPVAFAKIFTQLKTDDEPCNEVIALGHMMRDWLQKQVSDNSSYVDTGKGFSEYNLWVMCEGKELLISIKESK
jgi:hypothetical protein